MRRWKITIRCGDVPTAQRVFKRLDDLGFRNLDMLPAKGLVMVTEIMDVMEFFEEYLDEFTYAFTVEHLG